jgi:hypothetical protein
MKFLEKSFSAWFYVIGAIILPELMCLIKCTLSCWLATAYKPIRRFSVGICPPQFVCCLIIRVGLVLYTVVVLHCVFSVASKRGHGSFFWNRKAHNTYWKLVLHCRGTVSAIWLSYGYLELLYYLAYFRFVFPYDMPSHTGQPNFPGV